MNTKLYLAVFVTTIAVQIAYAGNGVSGGGMGKVCFSNKKVLQGIKSSYTENYNQDITKGIIPDQYLPYITKIEALDLQLARNKGKSNIPLYLEASSLSEKDYLLAIIHRLQTKLPGLAKIMNKYFDYFSGSTFMVSGQLNKTFDVSFKLQDRENCFQLNLATQFGKGDNIRIQFDERLFFHNSHNIMSRRVILLHELVYLFSRTEFGHVKSDGTLELVSELIQPVIKVEKINEIWNKYYDNQLVRRSYMYNLFLQFISDMKDETSFVEEVAEKAMTAVRGKDVYKRGICKVQDKIRFNELVRAKRPSQYRFNEQDFKRGVNCMEKEFSLFYSPIQWVSKKLDSDYKSYMNEKEIISLRTYLEKAEKNILREFSIKEYNTTLESYQELIKSKNRFIIKCKENLEFSFFQSREKRCQDQFLRKLDNLESKYAEQKNHFENLSSLKKYITYLSPSEIAIPDFKNNLEKFKDLNRSRFQLAFELYMQNLLNKLKEKAKNDKILHEPEFESFRKEVRLETLKYLEYQARNYTFSLSTFREILNNFAESGDLKFKGLFLNEVFIK